MIRRSAHSSAGAVPVRTRKAPPGPRGAWSRLRWGLAFAGIAVGVVYLSWSVIWVLGASAVLAYLCDPAVGRLEGRGYSRDAGIVLLGVAGSLVFTLVLLVLVPGFVRQFGELAGNIIPYFDTLADRIVPLLERVNALLGTQITLDLRELGRELPAYIQKMSPDMRARVEGVAKDLASGSLQVVLSVLSVSLMPVFTFYLLRDWPRILDAADGMVPLSHRPGVRRIAREIDARIGAFVRGQMLVAFILTCIYTVGLFVSGIDLALSMGLLSGALFLLPYLGPLTAATMSVTLALLKFGFDWHVGVVAGTYIFGQVLENNVLTPYLIGDRVGLHPMVVMVAIIVFGNVLGIWGLILALPLTAILAVLFAEVVRVYRESRAFQG